MAKAANKTNPPDDNRAQTVREFCAEIGIHPATYYRSRDIYPPLRKIGTKTSRIFPEDRRAWKARLFSDESE